MALDNDGFDFYSAVASGAFPLNSRWTEVGVGLAAITSDQYLVAGRYGGQAMRIALGGGASSANNGVYMLRAMDTLGSRVRCGFNFRRSDLSETTTGSPIMQFARLGTGCGGLHVNSSGAVYVSDSTGTAGAQVGSASVNNTLLVNTWAHIEINMLIHPTAGEARVAVEGVDVLNLTGISTAPAGVSNADQIRLWERRAVTTSVDSNADFDDINWDETVSTNALLGPRAVGIMVPNADTAQKDFTPSTGSDNYPMLDETLPNGDTDYNQGAVVNYADLFDLTNLSLTPQAVDLVKVNVINRKTDTGAVVLAALLKSAGIQSQGPSFAASGTASYGNGSGRYPTDPSTGVAFLGSALAGLQAGYKIVSL